MKPQSNFSSPYRTKLDSFGNILFIICVTSSVLVQSQMVAVSTDITDHTPTKETSKDSSTTSTQTSTASPKAKVHAQIALEHLDRQHESSDDDEEVGQVTRKDKSKEFQNPARHASEEGLLYFLLEQYKLSSDDVEEQLEILQNLINFSHKYENGRDLFSATDALKTILLPALNSTSIEIRKAACSIFAIAGQNNGIVKSKSMEAGVVRHMIHMVTFDTAVRSKALFAISSLLRNYPDAQKKFIQDGGVSEIIKTAFLPETRRRSITFLMDLINERKFCDSEAHAKRRSKSSDEHDNDNSELFSDDPCDTLNLLVTALKNGEWCDLLSDSIQKFHSFGTEDQSLVIEAIDTSLEFCVSKITTLDPYFHQLLRKYESDPDFEGTKKQLERILSAISSPTVLSRAHIEL